MAIVENIGFDKNRIDVAATAPPLGCFLTFHNDTSILLSPHRRLPSSGQRCFPGSVPLSGTWYAMC